MSSNDNSDPADNSIPPIINFQLAKKLGKLHDWALKNPNPENTNVIEGFRNTFTELIQTPDQIKEAALYKEIDDFISKNDVKFEETIIQDENPQDENNHQGGRRRSSTARKSSSRRGRRSSKKRATKSKPKRRQRRASRRAY
jgi:hypothetical protein